MPEKAYIKDFIGEPILTDDVSFYMECATKGYYQYDGYREVNGTIYHFFTLYPPE